ncbi:endoplasmic reticulum membrane sensor NFE2L1 [Bombina bombina]|uniref:endoplasmic reticulum membrane sensor NFE2L1 n=1 Tax=Bombina bombina TaxID=8345 RepID=UPI00235B2CAA|nr:endoplasmic reticulum membrane sensor NFE2L1 [Bombina bombina]XP_053553395.1 endoplasmic reticulum membrane sensor NFE2L1 [Bombina bombina]XP_053553405.1 endoplasmic reticulum membrane sensor NFE2L1 [Bombina bombina]
MLSLKKYLTEGLIQFTILLSLMGVRIDLDSYLPSYLPPLHEIILGPTSAYTQTQFHSLRGTSDGYGVHPKSVDLDQFFTSRRLLSQVRALDRLHVPSTELDTWLVHREAEGSVSSAQTDPGRPPDSPQDRPNSDSSLTDSMRLEQSLSGEEMEDLGAVAPPGTSDLSKEDIDLIDILWRQDIDLGVGREDFENRQYQKENEDEWKPLGDSPRANILEPSPPIDGETGENIPQGDQTSLSLEECLSLLDVNFPYADRAEFSAPSAPDLLNGQQCRIMASSDGADGLLSPLLPDLGSSLDMEEQWQDLMSLMNMQNMDVNSSSSDPLYLNLDPPLQNIRNQGQTSFLGCSQNLSSVFTTMSESLSTSEPPLLQLSSHNSTNLNSTFGLTNLTEMLSPLQLNSTGNITLSPTLADPLGELLDEEALLDEISLMELALEEGFSQVQASQLQDELDSDSGLSLDSQRSPVSPSGSESSSSSSCSPSSSSFSEEGAVGYSTDSEIVDQEYSEDNGYQPEYSKFCRMSSQDPSLFQHLPFLEHVGHNHTYNMVPEDPDEDQPMLSTGSRRQMGFLERQAGRDEQRARALKIPFSNDKIINLPVEEFNELLAKYHLSEAQLCLVRDIRRRGKNKMAAQNCRKRKLDTILNLEQEVKRLGRERSSQLREKSENLRSLQWMKQEVENLYQEIFSQLRDQDGRPYSPQRYALHYTSNGSVVLMPRNIEGQQNRRHERKDRRK